MDVRESTLNTVVFESQSRVVDSQQMQNRCIQIMDRGYVFDRFETEFVGLSVALAFVNSCAGQERGKPKRVVIAALCAFLKHRHPAEFGAPDDQRVVQQSALS